MTVFVEDKARAADVVTGLLFLGRWAGRKMGFMLSSKRTSGWKFSKANNS
jgi:hypothetical protein